jgi:hypothetical protein
MSSALNARPCTALYVLLLCSFSVDVAAVASDRLTLVPQCHPLSASGLSRKQLERNCVQGRRRHSLGQPSWTVTSGQHEPAVIQKLTT